MRCLDVGLVKSFEVFDSRTRGCAHRTARVKEWYGRLMALHARTQKPPFPGRFFLTEWHVAYPFERKLRERDDAPLAVTSYRNPVRKRLITERIRVTLRARSCVTRWLWAACSGCRRGEWHPFTPPMPNLGRHHCGPPRWQPWRPTNLLAIGAAQRLCNLPSGGSRTSGCRVSIGQWHHLPGRRAAHLVSWRIVVLRSRQVPGPLLGRVCVHRHAQFAADILPGRTRRAQISGASRVGRRGSHSPKLP